MNRLIILLFISLLPFASNAQKDSNEIKQFVSQLDTRIPELLNDFIVPGTAIAIIENGEVILKKGYGLANSETKEKVTNTTGFNIGSISKTVAAWGVMKLVQEGKIDLDAPAEKYLTRWHLPESEFDANKVTIRRLLSHTAGLSLHGYPGWSPKDQLPTIEESLNGKNNGPGRVEMIMEPGTKWKYSGGGFSILQLIVEEVTGQRFEDYMQSQVLNPLGMSNSSYAIDQKIMAASSKEHNRFGEIIDFELFTAQAAAGLHTTIDDFALFAMASLYGLKSRRPQILSAATIKEMMEAAPASDGEYGLGYQVLAIDGTDVVLRGHGGANTGWHAYLMVDPVTNDGFIMVTNGGAGHNIYRQVFCDWIYWKNQVTMGNGCNIAKPIANKLKQLIDKNGHENIATVYHELKNSEASNYDFTEPQLNQLGYYYMGEKNVDAAQALFKINVDSYPYSSNVYDSYGEALLANGLKQEAIENYKKSVELNPGNDHGISVLKDLGIDTSDLIKEVVVDQATLESYFGRYEISPEFIITVFQEGKRMMASATGQGVFEIFPKAQNVFYLKVVEAQLVFNKNDAGDVESLTLMQNGGEAVGPRIKE
ncbi:MAG: serine hydrolase [Gilvibacter sp.]